MSRPALYALWFLVLLVAGTALAGTAATGTAPAAASSGTWITAVRIDRLHDEATGNEDVGGSGEIDYLHRFAAGATLSAGIEAFRLTEVEWLTTRLAGSAPLGSDTTLYGGVEIGPGRAQGASLTYFEGRAGITHRLGARPLFATLEGRHLDIGRLRGNQLLATLSAVVGGRHQLSATYGRSFDEALGDDLILLRWDGYLAKRALFAGVAWGQSQPETLAGNAPTERTTNSEIFVGVGLPGADGALTLVLAYQDLETASRASLTLVARRPRRVEGSP